MIPDLLSKPKVAEIVLIARANGWVEPTVYQGLYNAVERTVEPE
jgi:aflatoxin B1 aldehyde reductase